MFSISPEVDLFVMKTVQKVMNRFRYDEWLLRSHGQIRFSRTKRLQVI